MTDQKELVIATRHDRVALLTMNRPERHHALNRALSAALAGALDAASADPEVRVIVLTGSGEKAFCAGADMLETSGVEEKSASAPTSSATDAIGELDRVRLPVIAAINGYCYGGGARLAIGCDIRLASTNATFRLPGAEYGLVVAAATLPRLVGSSKAKELIFTARKFAAAEALEWGFLSSVHEPAGLLPAALELAEEIAGNSAAAVQASKAVIDAATLMDAARALENEHNRNLRGSADQVERFRAATKRVTGR